MKPSPARQQTLLAHRIAEIRFRAAGLDCTCGVTVRAADVEPVARAGSPEHLAEAWLAHRRAVGAPKAEVRTISYDHDAGYAYNGARR